MNTAMAIWHDPAGAVESGILRTADSALTTSSASGATVDQLVDALAVDAPGVQLGDQVRGDRIEVPLLDAEPLGGLRGSERPR